VSAFQYGVAMKKFFKWFLIFLVLLNVLILISGKTYLYKAVYYNFANIDDNILFENRVIPNGKKCDAWALGKDYNKIAMPELLAAQHARLHSIAYLVIKNDSIRFEKYWEGYDSAKLSGSFSMAKTFVSIMAGIAIDEGKIKSIDQPVADFLPEFKSGENSKVTIRHLLTMSSGLNWDESYANPLSKTTEAYYGNDLHKVIADLKVVDPPGKIFKYLSGNTQVLAFVLKKATGKTLSEYASEKLWKPMGADHAALWNLDKADGMEKAYCCFYSNARDFARFGKLYLNKGKWGDRQLVSEKYVEASLKPADLKYDNGQKNSCYGFSWWLLPNYKGHSVFYARGILGQYIIVVPDLKMIVVRLGKKRADRDPNDKHNPDVYTYIDGALEMYK
jgi:CubicO group peptidase (beta-lactamase class C family)